MGKINVRIALYSFLIVMVFAVLVIGWGMGFFHAYNNLDLCSTAIGIVLIVLLAIAIVLE